jgi:hypothetical protein
MVSYDNAQSNEQKDEDGPSLEKKQFPPVSHGSKWSPPPDNEMLQFLNSLDHYKSLSLQISNR